ncbi:hypothetical protein DFJ77DRAFT_481011 [Powellomyces hirtus]|nr:hypothetical protein DFJ77DRAFT_481011 [Powellomyces hirtus]
MQSTSTVLFSPFLCGRSGPTALVLINGDVQCRLPGDISTLAPLWHRRITGIAEHYKPVTAFFYRHSLVRTSDSCCAQVHTSVFFSHKCNNASGLFGRKTVTPGSWPCAEWTFIRLCTYFSPLLSRSPPQQLLCIFTRAWFLRMPWGLKSKASTMRFPVGNILCD